MNKPDKTERKRKKYFLSIHSNLGCLHKCNLNQIGVAEFWQIGKDTGGMFDNVLFGNSFGFVRQFKNRSFLGSFTGHKKFKLELIELNPENNYVRLMFCSTSGMKERSRTKH